MWGALQALDRARHGSHRGRHFDTFRVGISFSPDKLFGPSQARPWVQPVSGGRRQAEMKNSLNRDLERPAEGCSVRQRRLTSDALSPNANTWVRYVQREWG